MKTRLKFLIFMVTIALMLIPTVYAKDNLIGKVTAINNKDVILSGEVTNVVDDSDPSNVKLRYNNLNLKIIEENLSVGRKGDAAWLGFRITKPSEATEDAVVTRSGATIKIDDEGVYYTKITADILQNALLEGHDLEKKYEFDWNNDKVIDQTVTFIISPETIILKDKDSDLDAFNGPLEAEKINKNKIENPRTSDSNIYIFIGMILLSGFGIIYIIRKNILSNR